MALLGSHFRSFLGDKRQNMTAKNNEDARVCAGIDLGTSNSVLAILVNGVPEVVPNKEGERLTPSVVAYRQEVDGSVNMLVGRPARQQAHMNPENTFNSVKRFIGRQASELDDAELKRAPYRVDKVGSSLRVYCPLLDKLFAPEEISAQVMRKLSRDASERLGGKSIKDVVITVPAYFGDSQRLATKDAGKIAGLNVLRILNEPTGASLFWGLGKKETEVALIFDLGGGTFDVSIIEVGEGVFEVLATSGDTELGGDDFDRCIADWAMESFKREHNVDLAEDPMALQRVITASEKIKVDLSSLSESGMELPFIAKDAKGGSLHLSASLTREDFEGKCRDLITRCRAPLERALEDAKISPNGVGQTVLVGGSTRIPAVNRLVEEVMGKPPVQSVNPDEAVALGAALQAGVVTGRVKNVVLLDVVPMSLGIVVEGGAMAKLIERNTPIPINQSQSFSTVADNQPTVEIVVVQGEREVGLSNKVLGRFVLTGIEPAPAGKPSIMVTFSVTVDGTLSVSAKDEKTGAETSIVVEEASTLSKEEVESMLKSAQENASRDSQDLRASALLSAASKASGKLGSVPEGDREEEKNDLLRALENARRAEDLSLVEEILLKLRDMYPGVGILPPEWVPSAGSK